ncbi:UbiE/COQ5 methyltransferase [Pleurostoma richardsiae]|uniref:UbiE/COQ5 methyltransferase n=1 Tax=Pleurostoma richardsiae TaxID=41990 RepID=A0AA38RDY2_9PEZI|nr:UbiE/COQ5 methyltransferase [Pleurostoma richardsiae]
MVSSPREQATYTHGHHESVLRSHTWRTAENSAAYLLPQLQQLGPDACILDVGCGPGTITIDLARRVPGGRVVGVDLSAPVLEQARAAAQAAGVTNVEFVAGDANALTDFADGSFDVVHCHQVLQHVRDPVGVLRAMRRVARDGTGVVAARESDYGAFHWYSGADSDGDAGSALERWRALYMAVTRANGGDLRAGRLVHVWAKAAGFARPDVRCSASTWCFATPADVQWWSGLWADRTVASAFAGNAVQHGLATRAELEQYAAAWRAWGADEDAWYVVTHGEVLCYKR